MRGAEQHFVRCVEELSRKVLRMLQAEDKSYVIVQLVSFHSTSKGFIGECGFRGGYTEFVGMSPNVMALFVKVDSTSLVRD